MRYLADVFVIITDLRHYNVKWNTVIHLYCSKYCEDVINTNWKLFPLCLGVSFLLYSHSGGEKIFHCFIYPLGIPLPPAIYSHPVNWFDWPRDFQWSHGSSWSSVQSCLVMQQPRSSCVGRKVVEERDKDAGSRGNVRKAKDGPSGSPEELLSMFRAEEGDSTPKSTIVISFRESA